MGQRQFESDDADATTTPAETDTTDATDASDSVITVGEAIDQLDADALGPVARAAFAHAGELATLEYGRPAAVLGAIRLASRRSRHATLECERLAAVFDADPDAVSRADAAIASTLTPPADASTIRTLRRRLIVVEELLAAARAAESSAVPAHHTQQWSPTFADTAPWLLGRVEAAATRCEDAAPFGLDEDGLQAHADRLRSDLEFARLGTTLATLVARRQTV
ncbi:uncharacterized protein Nmag_2809 [Natrialba magadii ATCC 43099]|uniref:Uncharacterized protein n=1 Tax=Natrialba magadii (strain ATCC 43099 / DSM 3394 / CCM 3739 / CIP 104546 / IAM 13178 / JCM 8861 / NBRC 102185 / NCIMB 2190 / MS3) TaxID=547559 RepID=D3SZV3_NATMM|nr:hypothetical protein [Natrialba magadii]ADD06363.1 uncharacterized protein Nmag_2809 [Natrialba magadii ATCC 43099]ELY31494.1 hypothetical protein C500_06361 [Natrialba magadii ATCC 43099]